MRFPHGLTANAPDFGSRGPGFESPTRHARHGDQRVTVGCLAAQSLVIYVLHRLDMT